MSVARPLTWSWTMPTAQQARLELDGDLDFESADQVLNEVIPQIDENPALAELRLGCRRLGFCDSYGLSTLLMIHRRTRASGVRLQLDDRGPALDRLLRVTNTLTHLTDAPATSRERHLDP